MLLIFQIPQWCLSAMVLAMMDPRARKMVGDAILALQEDIPKVLPDVR